MKRKTKRGATYHLRWICPQSRKWKARKVGTDKKRAERQAAVLEQELQRGTYQDIRRIGWDEFVAEHVEHIEGVGNAREAKRTLMEFGNVRRIAEPRRVTFADVEAYVDHLRSGDVENAQATINKKLRYIRAAFNLAIHRGYAAQNPMKGWRWTREQQNDPRIATTEEETAILKAAGEMYGARLQAFIRFALASGARRSEAVELTWDRIDLDTGRVRLTKTKSKRNRTVYVNAHMTAELRRLKAEALEGDDTIRLVSHRGPFASLRDNLGRSWGRVVRRAGILGLSIHDLRRTYITRQIQAGVPLPTVQKLAGHADIKTTLLYYNLVSEDDLKAAMVRPNAAAAG